MLSYLLKLLWVDFWICCIKSITVNIAIKVSAFTFHITIYCKKNFLNIHTHLKNSKIGSFKHASKTQPNINFTSFHYHRHRHLPLLRHLYPTKNSKQIIKKIVNNFLYPNIFYLHFQNNHRHHRLRKYFQAQNICES